MYFPVRNFNTDEFIQTPTGVKVSRSALMCSPQNLEMPGGKSIILANTIIRGDFSRISIHKYSFIDEDCVLRPSYMMTEGKIRFIPMHIGKYTSVGKGSILESASIGLGCSIGANCILSPRCILKDYVTVEDGTVVPPDMVIPPYAIVAGCPARIVAESPESHCTTIPIQAKMRFKMFQPVDKVNS